VGGRGRTSIAGGGNNPVTGIWANKWNILTAITATVILASFCTATAFTGCLFAAGAIGSGLGYSVGAATGENDGSPRGLVASSALGGLTVGASRYMGMGRILTGPADEVITNTARIPGITRAGAVKLPGVPTGVSGIPVQSGKGLEYSIPRGTRELDPRVTSIRIMDPVTSGKYQYPNGYVSYMNSGGQVVNPVTGETLQRSDSLWHIPLP
jgi:hypothetical protein